MCHSHYPLCALTVRLEKVGECLQLVLLANHLDHNACRADVKDICPEDLGKVSDLTSLLCAAGNL